LLALIVLRINHFRFFFLVFARFFAGYKTKLGAPGGRLASKKRELACGYWVWPVFQGAPDDRAGRQSRGLYDSGTLKHSGFFSRV
jgi:hypothetical protein